jgi:hypothetical protein
MGFASLHRRLYAFTRYAGSSLAIHSNSDNMREVFGTVFIIAE